MGLFKWEMTLQWEMALSWVYSKTKALRTAHVLNYHGLRLHYLSDECVCSCYKALLILMLERKIHDPHEYGCASPVRSIGIIVLDLFVSLVALAPAISSVLKHLASSRGF